MPTSGGNELNYWLRTGVSLVVAAPAPLSQWPRSIPAGKVDIERFSHHYHGECEDAAAFLEVAAHCQLGVAEGDGLGAGAGFTGKLLAPAKKFSCAED